MSQISNPNPTLRRLFKRATLPLTALMAFGIATSAPAAVVVNENAEWPAEATLETFARTDGNVDAERDARGTRNLAQTFQVSAPVKLDKLFIDYGGGIAGKE